MSPPSSIVGMRRACRFWPQLVAAQQKDPEGFDLAAFLLRDEVRIDKSGDEPRLMTFQVSDWWRDEVEFKPVDSPPWT